MSYYLYFTTLEFTAWLKDANLNSILKQGKIFYSIQDVIAKTGQKFKVKT